MTQHRTPNASVGGSPANGQALGVNAETSTQPAAFFRVEGVLVSRPAIAAAAWFSVNAQKMGERLARLGSLALATPLALAGELRSGSTAARMAWSSVRGMSEDRLLSLAEEYFETYVEKDIEESGKRLLSEARRQGFRPILISDNIDLLVAPLAEQLEVSDVICNRLEIRNGRCTGRLEDPVIGGNVAGPFARAFAAEEGIDLLASRAYGASGADALLLSAIGEPCAVNPDRQLRRLAKDHGWVVVNAD